MAQEQLYTVVSFYDSGRVDATRDLSREEAEEAALQFFAGESRPDRVDVWTVDGAAVTSHRRDGDQVVTTLWDGLSRLAVA